MERLLTPEEAAALLRISVYTVKKYARKGTVPAIKVGGVWRFPESALVSASPPICPASIRHGAFVVRDAASASGGLVEQYGAGSPNPANQPAYTLYERRIAASRALDAIRERSKPCSVEELIREAKEGQRFRGDE